MALVMTLVVMLVVERLVVELGEDKEDLLVLLPMKIKTKFQKSR